MIMLDNEKDYDLKTKERCIRNFIEKMKQVDREQGALLEKEGWFYKETAERCVVFTFGKVTLIRRCYVKNGKRCYPVDEYLGLTPYNRYSKFLLYQLALTKQELSCRKAAIYFEELFHVEISKDTVSKARRMANQLYKENQKHSFFKEEIFIEEKKLLKYEM